jgi:hypothetical protein
VGIIDLFNTKKKHLLGARCALCLGFVAKLETLLYPASKSIPVWKYEEMPDPESWKFPGVIFPSPLYAFSIPARKRFYLKFLYPIAMSQ